MNNAIFVSLPKRKIFIVTLKRVITLLNDGRANANLGRKHYAKGKGTQEAQGKCLADSPSRFFSGYLFHSTVPQSLGFFFSKAG